MISTLLIPVVGERICCSSSSIIGSEISGELLRISKGFLEASGIGGDELPSPRAFPAEGVPDPFDVPFPLDLLLCFDGAAFWTCLHWSHFNISTSSSAFFLQCRAK
jgi:hypothetical protein